jgi:NAD(P)-dependent dehydrogenase (short-subunit alcohol dehydrogenase family)
MDLGLKGKSAVVTGSTAGIGFAIAETLAAEGAHVVLNGRTQERVTAAIERIAKKNPKVNIRGVAGDLGTAKGVEDFVRQIPEADILVNNLGIFQIQDFLQIPDSEWLRFFEVNVLSGVRLTRHYLPGMLEKKWGRVIFISSESAAQTPKEMVHYGMTKTAQISVARGLAETCTGTAVTVNSVLAGPTASEGVTQFVAALAKEKGMSLAEVEKEFFRSIRPTSLLKRFIQPEEVAAVVVFACSPEASAIQGSALRAEGGVVKSAF